MHKHGFTRVRFSIFSTTARVCSNNGVNIRWVGCNNQILGRFDMHEATSIHRNSLLDFLKQLLDLIDWNLLFYVIKYSTYIFIRDILLVFLQHGSGTTCIREVFINQLLSIYKWDIFSILFYQCDQLLIRIFIFELLQQFLHRLNGEVLLTIFNHAQDAGQLKIMSIAIEEYLDLAIRNIFSILT